MEEGLGGLWWWGRRVSGSFGTERGIGLTSRRRENGRHALKVAFLRKLVIKSGQLCVVKLLPKLLSKGLGSGLGLEVPEAELPLVAEEPATVVVDVVD